MSVDFDRMAANLPADQRKQLSREYRRGAKNETTAFLSCFFLGIFGVHQFYLGKWARGLAHLILPLVAAIVLVAGVLGDLPSLLVTIVVTALLVAGLIWEVVDLFQIDGAVRKRNLALAESLIGADALADSASLKDAVARLDSAVAGAGTPAGVLSGTISAADVSAARAMAGDHNNAIMEEFDSMTTKYISDDPNATSPGAPVSWSETAPTQSAASAEDTLDMPAPEYVTHTHTETADTVTDSFEFDRSPDTTQPVAVPTADESQAATWPDHPPMEAAADEPVHELADTGVPLAGLAAGAAALGAGALLAEAAGAADAGAAGAAGPDVTDHHAYVPEARPIADVEGAGAAPQYVALPDEQPMAMTAPAAASPASPDIPVAAAAAEDVGAGYAPLAVDASTTGHDATDAHPHAPHPGLVGDVDVNPAQPVYIDLPPEDLPPETYVPPAVPVMDASADDTLVGLAAAGAAGAGAAFAGSQLDAPAEAAPAAPEAPEAMPEAAPTSGPLMKRIRMKRQIVVDGKVVREEMVEKLVPVDTDTSGLVAEMDTELGHATKEEIAHMANLDPDASLDLRQRTEAPHPDGEPSAE
ncbi:MAG: TM2 domain-containing protein [Nitrososphaerota archaeon]